MHVQNKSAILLGGSGHALVVAEAWESSDGKCIGYMDRCASPLLHLPYLGFEDDETFQFREGVRSFLPAIGDNRLRKKAVEKLIALGGVPCSVIHREAKLCIDTVVGVGTLIARGALINPRVVIGAHCIINTGAIVEHECVIDDYAHLAPGSILCGGVKVGKNTFIGAGSIIKQGVHIGNDVIIGAGSVVLKNIPDGETQVGNPAKKMYK